MGYSAGTTELAFCLYTLVPAPAPTSDHITSGGAGTTPNIAPMHNRHHHGHNRKSKKGPTTKTPTPTSPHKLHQVAIFDVVAEVADIDTVLTLAMLGKLYRFFVRSIYWSTKRARNCFRWLAIAIA